jgi:hypothetical protein
MTEIVATLIPFSTRNYFSENDLPYGINRATNAQIVLDRILNAKPPVTIESVYNFIYTKEVTQKNVLNIISDLQSDEFENFNYETIKFTIDNLYSDKLRIIKNDHENGVLTFENLKKYLSYVPLNISNVKNFQKEQAQDIYDKFDNSLSWELAEIKFAYARSIYRRNPDGALKLYEEVCNLEPTNSYYMCMFAKNLINQGVKDKGQDMLIKAGKIEPVAVKPVKPVKFEKHSIYSTRKVG